MRLEQVVPWGRSMAEYRDMFDLSDLDLDRSILDCAGGPASFNAEMTALGKSVISCDPVYQFSAAQIQQRIDETAPKIIESVGANYDKFVWDKLGTIERLIDTRMQAMKTFLADFSTGKEQGRYRVEGLPNLPFEDDAFELVISSHLLFTYSDQLSLDFHLQAIADMLRVSKEVRIFPLLVNMTGEVSPYVDNTIAHFQLGHRVEIHPVPYEFQKGGNRLLKIQKII
jgi:SAM-dependent methyltransferase